MKKLFCCALVVSALVLSAPAAEARELSLTIANGRVTLIAHDATVRQILDEWARVGQTRIVNGDKLLGTPMTLELRDVPEAKALDTVLRSAAGYLVAPRSAGSVGASFFDRIMILPTSRAPAVTSAPPAQFNRAQPPPQPVMPVVDDDQPEPGAPPPGQPVVGQPFPGPAPQQPASQPGMQQPVNTLPRPGMLPPAPTGPGNPYQPQPGVVRPPGSPGGPGGGTGPGGGPGGGGGS